METCANCDRVIGKLEKPHVWQDQVVCASCHKTLSEFGGPAAGSRQRLDAPPPPPPSYLPPMAQQSTYVPPKRSHSAINHTVWSSILTVTGAVLAIISGSYIAEGYISRSTQDLLRALLILGLLLFFVGVFWFIINRIRNDH